jgi:NADPH2:quinone reductase
VTVAASALVALPSDIDPVAFASIGLAGVTALEAMRRLGPLEGKTLLVSGATGGVGAVAVDIGRALRANVVALTRDSPRPQPASADAVLDGVAGPLFPVLVAALRPGGRYSIIGAAAGGEVCFDAWNLLDGRVLTGYSSESLDGDTLRAATRELLALRVPQPPTSVFPLFEGGARTCAARETCAARARRARAAGCQRRWWPRPLAWRVRVQPRSPTRTVRALSRRGFCEPASSARGPLLAPVPRPSTGRRC